MHSVVKLEDVNGQPQIFQELPGPLRIGDPLRLRFRTERQTTGRREVLEVDHLFRVTSIGLDASRTPQRQLLSVASVGGKPPTWRSVKARPAVTRALPPAVSPRTPI